MPTDKIKIVPLRNKESVRKLINLLCTKFIHIRYIHGGKHPHFPVIASFS